MILTNEQIEKWKASTDGKCVMVSDIHLGKQITVRDLLDTLAEKEERIRVLEALKLCAICDKPIPKTTEETVDERCLNALQARIDVLEAQVADVHQSYQSGKAWQEQEARLTEQLLNKEELAVIYLVLPSAVADRLIKHLRTQQARIDRAKGLAQKLRDISKTKSVMKSWETGECVALNIVEDWADELLAALGDEKCYE
jgi:hypothetical protein